jgi:DNA-binding CsgD family transcriptional regulator
MNGGDPAAGNAVPTPATELSLLSPRETEILVLTSSGLTNREIARQLSVSVHAVKFHLAAVYRKLHVANRTEAASAYFRSLAAADGRAEGA